jgi:hypothetical protein
MTSSSEPRDMPALRGPEAQPIGRQFWLLVGALLVIVLAFIVTVSFVSAVNDNSRIDRLKSHGIPVTVTVTDCVGNIGGSGSNAAGYTCQGKYRVNGVSYHEVIASKTTLSTAGSTVRGVADPARPSTIELASAVASSSPSNAAYVVPSLLAVLLVALATTLHRYRRSNARTQLGGSSSSS